jgi:GAF domain-containing protein
MNAESLPFRGTDKATISVNHSLTAVPITFQEGKPGLLEVVTKTGGVYYTEENLAILETLASQAAIAIRNAVKNALHFSKPVPADAGSHLLAC